ncbi:LysR family transcriptional regulator [Gymnodinialimonas ceratoperidinii]|uniref:LysR family transcriptional regulator n=1 Tax=Gymnodinialimonas ceratoperidinii TaxID=2856823 RepID=A0A8F6TYP6_9RHOB|nr:LysR family transcriptional regulator [Gymnodinialimonas ceratoperidinii]QXT40888.1 LysR family transcriptional regulator [Gymnodinialimonas ceratoperidinii]
MQDLKPIRVFLTVVELNSFAAAARSLGMTPASVTRIVARLEEDLGQQLLVRTTRRVSLTTAGAMVAARYRPVVADFDQITEEIARAVRPDRGRLSINAPMSLGLRLMPSLVDRFRLAYPNITLEVHLTDALVDIVEERCDLAVRISGPPSDKSTIWRKVCEVPRHLVAAPELFNRVPRPKSPEDLDPAVCMSYSSTGGAESWKLSYGGRNRNVLAGDSVVSNNGDFLYELAKAGNGIALLPDFITSEGIASGEVEAILADWAAPPLWLTLFYPPYEVLPPLVATFSDFFEAHLREATGLNFEAIT